MGDYDELQGHDPVAEEDAVKPVAKKKESDADDTESKTPTKKT